LAGQRKSDRSQGVRGKVAIHPFGAIAFDAVLVEELAGGFRKRGPMERIG
jgi:hypothetical protein